jgi:hypothetical protein
MNAKSAKGMRGKLNHGGTTGTTEEKRKSLEPPINANERR